MALVTSYATLQTHVALTLNRSDLTAVVPNFIQQFEASARRGINIGGVVVPVRKLIAIAPFSVGQDNLSMPADLGEIDSWYHDGDTYYGPIVNAGSWNEIGRLKGRFGATGVPEFFALVNRSARFAPVPDATYTTKLSYWANVVSLSADITSNWLLVDHPDIYIYGALLESAPYLKDDIRVGMWEKMLADRVLALDQMNQNLTLGGAIQRQYEPIGG